MQEELVVKSESEEAKITIYMQDGRSFFYYVKNAQKAREHCHRIITCGFHNLEDGKLVYYPVHQILKVSFPLGPQNKLPTEYQSNAGSAFTFMDFEDRREDPKYLKVEGDPK